MRLMRTVARLLLPALLTSALIVAGQLTMYMPRWMMFVSAGTMAGIATAVWMVWTCNVEVRGEVRGYALGLAAGKRNTDHEMYKRGERWGYSCGWGSGYQLGARIALVDWAVRTGLGPQPTDDLDALASLTRADDGADVVGDEARDLDALASTMRGEALHEAGDSDGQ